MQCSWHSTGGWQYTCAAGFVWLAHVRVHFRLRLLSLRGAGTEWLALRRRIAGELERRHTQCPAKCGQVLVVYRSHTDTLAAKAMSQWMLPSVVHPPSALQGQISACSRGRAQTHSCNTLYL